MKFNDFQRRFSGEWHFYGNATHAMHDVLTWLQENRPYRNPNVVMPVYVPAKLYRMAISAGYTPRFYDVSLDCRLDPARVKEQVNADTQAVIGIHYFGIPSPLRRLREYLDSRNVFLIEDCAHSLGGSQNGLKLGRTGDFAVFSSRKMLQLPAGGMLVLNRCPWSFRPTWNCRVRSLYTACKGTRIRLKSLYHYLCGGRDPLGLAWIPGTGRIDLSEEQHFTIRKISWLNKLYTRSVDLRKMARRRRRNYEHLLNGIADIPGLEPPGGWKDNPALAYRGGAWRLKGGVVPYSLPLLAPAGTRETLRHRLRKAGIGCGAGWPESPFGQVEYTQATELGRRMLELPIHQGIPRSQLNRAIGCLKSPEHDHSLPDIPESTFSWNKLQSDTEVA